MSSKDWIDITVTLKPDMNYLALDPVPPKIFRISDVNNGDPVTMSKLEIISHTGTHVDTPLHFIPGGSTITDMPLDATVGPARVIEIKDQKMVTVEELEPYNIKEGERILLKTRNSPVTYESSHFVEDYVYISSDAARYLADKKIRMVGLDNITIGDFRDEESIVAAVRIDFTKTDILSGAFECLNKLFCLISWVEPVRGVGCNKVLGTCPGKGFDQ